MKFNVSGKLTYDIKEHSTIILNIHAIRSAAQTVLRETFSIEPYHKSEELIPVQGENRYIRFEVPEPVVINIDYSALIDTSFKKITGSLLNDVPVMQLPPQVLPYLSPSRYCQSDKLYRFANSRFGKIDNAFERVLALTDWIFENVEYLSGSTNSETSAYDTVTEQAGVCRDFAHLGIALCRALSIPARYFTGYSYLLKPSDFHACFEAFLGNEWVLFDATKLAPLNGLVKIATGRDAADTAIATIFGNVVCTAISVSCELAEEKFKPFNYDRKKPRGLTYL
ncbi:transglutaminase-like putative cysteine protease [Mucilaginibacter gracilis]|uniref:Transglutaminase-like putative cysteine protease n=1 Tax=Mucilaginibacter gracilis TaxID=423350 RepID=A0A495J4C0_9SPHI|nr:transglutaminase family protein [Mucilaginibacter gracilis]RKR83442.1 transglutaminase-like putative cysteine protease [Mucilaginibacter gracilis]